MNIKLFLCSLLISFATVPSFAQELKEYTDWIKKANAFYDAKDYKQSADAYTHAFAANGGKGMIDDRYNAACSWAQAGNKDSAFFQLNRIATKANFADYGHLLVDGDLVGLHTDKRWGEICDLVKQNKEKAEVNFNKPIVAILDTVLQNDQGGRMKIEDVEKKYGGNSKEMTALWKEINFNDSIDLLKVEKILDKYGWPGSDVVGQQGNLTLFLVVQHSDIKVQEKYLPIMREAVKNKKASPADLAMLEDRVALREGKKQIYGSQIHGEPEGEKWISPLEDPDNVDKKKGRVGLGPLADYVAQWGIKWDPVAYKKQLPEIEKKDKW